VYRWFFFTGSEWDRFRGRQLEWQWWRVVWTFWYAHFL